MKEFGHFLGNHDRKLKTFFESSQHSYRAGNDLKKCTQPIVNIKYSSNTENLPITKLFESERLLNKTILTFAYLCNEVNDIIADSKEMQIKFLYIDEDLCSMQPLIEDSENQQTVPFSTNEKIIYKMSNSMELLCNMQYLLQRSIIIGNNILHQCGAFLSFEKQAFEFRFHVRLISVNFLIIFLNNKIFRMYLIISRI